MFLKGSLFQLNPIIGWSIARFLSTKPNFPTDYMMDILKRTFPKAINIEVVDVSGGCGAMYEVLVESKEFKGIPIVKQHRMVTDALKEQIREMHGLRIHTVVPRDLGSNET